MTDRPDFISIEQVCAKITVSRATLWRMIRRGDFPKPVSISPGRVGVDALSYEAWREARATAQQAA